VDIDIGRDAYFSYIVWQFVCQTKEKTEMYPSEKYSPCSGYILERQYPTPRSYRLMSNLCFMSTNVENVVAVRFSKHLTDNDPSVQIHSAYRPNHSTETTLLRVHNDLLCKAAQAQGCHTSATRSIGSIRYDRSHNHVKPPKRSVWNNCNMPCMMWVVFSEPKSV